VCGNYDFDECVLQRGDDDDGRAARALGLGFIDSVPFCSFSDCRAPPDNRVSNFALYSRRKMQIAYALV